MRLLPHIVGILAAFATGGLLLAYPLVGERIRPWVLYFAVCALGVTVAIIGLLTAASLEAILKYLKRMEPRQGNTTDRDSG